MLRLLRLIYNGFSILFTDGPRILVKRLRAKVMFGILGRAVHMPVSAEEATAADWSFGEAPRGRDITVASGPIEIAWIMSPPSPTSGGHQNLLRFIDFAAQAGHHSTIYFYTTSGINVNIEHMQQMLNESAAYPQVTATLKNYDPRVGVGPADALFATGWETAYPVYIDPSPARRFYFVQDFEPSFFPAGSEATLAENTYHFGFHGITAGRWLAHKLATDYGMTADYFDFAVDKTHYTIVNHERRNEIFFYARPVTPRRGFELGVLALHDFAEQRPDVVINLAGWDVSNWRLPFKFHNHSGLAITELNGLYNRCAAGLVLSMSNMSLLPLELMSSGVTPVINDAPNNRMVYDSEFISYVPPTPRALSRALRDAVDRDDQVERAIAMSESVSRIDWEHSGRQFTDALERVMRG